MNGKKTGEEETQQRTVVDGFKRYLRVIFQNRIKDRISTVRE